MAVDTHKDTPLEQSPPPQSRVSRLRHITKHYSRGIRWKLATSVGSEPSFETTDANPEKVIFVSPDDIQFENTLLEKSQLQPGRVYGGSWDTSRVRFEETKTYRAVADHFVHGVDWAETEQYQHSLEKIRGGGESRGSTTPAELERRYETLETIYDDIRENGYRTQRELLAERPEATRELVNDGVDVTLNEISVCIGRDGTFYRQGSGRHRLAIAKILDLPEIPVQVRVRYERWQRTRDRIRTGERTDHVSHPDVEALQTTREPDADDSKSVTAR